MNVFTLALAYPHWFPIKSSAPGHITSRLVVFTSKNNVNNKTQANPVNARHNKHTIIANGKAKQESPLRQAHQDVVRSNSVNLWFSRFASRTATLVGHPYMFLAAVVVLVIWAVSGPFFHFSDTWQLIINTGTTIITFLVVFLIQNTQNRDAKALHLKLDELIRSHVPAHNDMIDIEKLSDEELEDLKERYAALCQESDVRNARRKTGAGEP
jgi:low affinity Fe/Cu permease